MPQGNMKLKKPIKKTKPVRGDQQKLRKGKFTLKPNSNTRARADFDVQQRISKMIAKKVEDTIANRASTDGAGLSVVQAEGMASKKRDRPLATSSSSGKKKRKR
mmetsp:Transcript_59466/g.98596  ORF Transcript_59466/g.98596 Transcript_59466/m.98596 type:complete len:104 (+) Transcript_59466:37-348(+)